MKDQTGEREKLFREVRARGGDNAVTLTVEIDGSVRRREQHEQRRQREGS